MQTNERIEEEKLWLVRYIYKSDLAALSESRGAEFGHALFLAHDEEQVCRKLTSWLRLVLHEEAIIESVESMLPNELKRLPVRRARQARYSYKNAARKRMSSLTRRFA